MQKKKLVILSGAGISAESGLKTFRDAGGLWEGHKVEDVATPEAWRRNPKLVLDFYNERRKACLAAAPNMAHQYCVKLESQFDTHIITQNVDNLHERAGSKNVLHLHGELFKSRSTLDESLVYDIPGWELNLGDTCELGSQLRPHIVWFGEMVPLIVEAERLVAQADILVVVGTSLQVYPAAGLTSAAKPECPIYVIDPAAPQVSGRSNVHYIKEKAEKGMAILSALLMEK
jgi:NAD-dependent deacetylase